MPFVQAGDVRVHYIEAGAGDPLLLLHGNWATSSWWEPLLARLPEGLRGIAPDMRGRGRTEGPDTDYSIPSLAADALALLDALGLERVHLLGHSLGAGVAIQLALEHPERARSLVALAPPWVDGMPLLLYNPARQVMLKENRALFAAAIKAQAPSVEDGEYWQRLVDEGHGQSLAATLGAHDSTRDWRPGDSLRAIPCPKLVISGEHDLLLSPEVCERAAQALGARHVTVPGVGHSANVEAPDRLATIVWQHVAQG
ncbi:MAG: hypothetical protein RLZZ387_289 [Chloroflexota bacterium]|jgi:pimeloyl-ACP methyl ester carboxylesterase